MNLPTYFINTSITAFRSLVPGKSIRCGHLPQRTSEFIALKDRLTIATFLNNPESALDNSGTLAIAIPCCSCIVSPLILFRLKRLGFSACRIWNENGSLFLKGSR
jgi:hypothetical protein